MAAMPITLLSPHSGKPVKIRDQDVGRAVRDEEKRVFYALPRPDGSGHYGALTRNGSDKDLARYDALESKVGAGAAHVRQVAATHDARGPGRSGSPLRLVAILLLVGLTAVGAWLGYRALLGGGQLPAGAPALPSLPGGLLPSPSPTPPAPAGWRIAPAAWAETAQASPPADRRARALDYAVVRYELARPDGRVIDATNPLRPLGFVVWSGAAFRGLDATVAGMEIGETRTVELAAAEVDRSLAAGNAGRFRLTVELVDLLAGVTKEVLQAGDAAGRAAEPGDRLTLAWSVRVPGRPEPIVSTEDTGGPATVTLGAGDLIAGLEQGLAGMRPGEEAEFTVPPHFAYGDAGCAGGLVPPDASLLVRVTLLGAERAR